MKIAYLVLAHNNPKHLLRLIKSLSSSSSSFFIHVDSKSNLSEFAGISGDNINFLEDRIPVYWGDFSQVDAILCLIRTALSQQEIYDYFVLLSGVDYPLRSVAYIESFFEKNSEKEFINIVQMPCPEMGKPISRLTTFKSRPGDLFSKIVAGVRKTFVRMGLSQIERDYKRYLRSFVPYGGSTWWALSRKACEYIQDFVDKNSVIVNFYKNTICPDESFFQTILGNSPYLKRIERNFTYTDWSGGAPSPAIISERHLRLFESSSSVVMNDGYGFGEALFARKFSDQSDEIVKKIDNIIKKEECIAKKFS